MWHAENLRRLGGGKVRPLHAVSIAIAALLFRSLKDERWYLTCPRRDVKPDAH